MTTIAPNPHSPYASAAPDVRHIFASPTFFPDPNPGVLALTACEGMAVVAEELVQTEPGAPLPDGLCPACVTVMEGGEPPKRESSQCGECGSATWHGVLCALCRQDKHEAWWLACGKELAEARAAGCALWEVTERSISRVDDELDRLGVYAKGYWQEVDGKLTVVSLRVGTGETRVVAKFGDWLVLHPDGSFTVHQAPAAVETGE
jgi:hypothetical protein